MKRATGSGKSYEARDEYRETSVADKARTGGAATRKNPLLCARRAGAAIRIIHGPVYGYLLHRSVWSYVQVQAAKNSFHE
jgi:hypothetical protein